MNVAVAPRTINTLSLYTGSGFADTAASIALETLGYRVRAVGYVERDSAAAAVLMARMANSTLHPAPVWCDCLSRMDARPLRGWVDVLLASPPCQPYSSAGKQLGNADHRSHGDGDGPLVHTVRIIDESEPAVVFFENVPEWFTGGHFREFGEQLCDLGFDIAPPFFGSSGATGNVHERERVFCMLVHAERLRSWQGEQGEHAGVVHRDRPAKPSDSVADTHFHRFGAQGPNDQYRQPDVERRGGRDIWLANADGAGLRAGGESERGPDVPDARGDGLAVSACRGLGAVRQPPRGSGQSDGHNDRLGEPSRSGREGSQRHGPHGPGSPARGPVGEPGGAFVPPLCPPGRPIFDDELAAFIGRDSTTLGALRGRIAGSAEAMRQWMELARGGLDPTLMPAVEPGVPMVAHASAEPLFHHADLLRIGGNGVDVLVYADAFRRLWVEHVEGRVSRKEVEKP